MGAIAVQSAIGSASTKVTTELPTYNFNSMAVINGIPFAANSEGLFRLNTGTTDNGTAFTSTIIFATTDFNIRNPKKMRFIYIGFEADNNFTVSVRADDQAWRDITVVPAKSGLQRRRVPIGRDGQGRYWTVKISSTSSFRIDSVEAMVVVRSTGIISY